MNYAQTVRDKLSLIAAETIIADLKDRILAAEKEGLDGFELEKEDWAPYICAALDLYAKEFHQVGGLN